MQTRSVNDELVRLREQVDTLSEENRQLKEALSPSTPDWGWRFGLTRQQTIVLDRLLTVQLWTREQALAVMEMNRIREGDALDPKLPDVVLVSVRRQLAFLGAKIHRQHSVGWYMLADDKQKVRDFLAGTKVLLRGGELRETSDPVPV
jgi:hypothetical protein